MDQSLKKKLAKRDYDGFFLDQLKTDGDDKVFQKEQKLLGVPQIKDTKEQTRIEEKKVKLKFKKELLLPSRSNSRPGSPSNTSFQEQQAEALKKMKRDKVDEILRKNTDDFEFQLLNANLSSKKASMMDSSLS